MATNTNWLDRGQVYDLSYNTYFNVKVILDANGVLDLANYIIVPNVEGFFSTATNWISSLIYFPFELYTSSETKLKLQIGPTKTDIPAIEANPIIEWYNLGEWFCAPHFNNFADYNGYTKIEVFLPFLGTVEIMPNDVMNKFVQFRLKVDINTGQGIYYIGVSDTSITPTNPPYAGDEDANVRILSVNTVQLGVQIPLGTTNTIEVVRNIIMGSVKAAAMATGAYTISSLKATGGVSTTTTVKTARNKKTGRQITQYKKTESTEYDTSKYQYGKSILDCFETGADALNAAFMRASSDKPNNTLALVNAPKSIKIVRYLPKLKSYDTDYNKLYGKPLGEVVKLNTLTGYTEIGGIHIEGDAFKQATLTELLKLKEQLTQGIIL